MSQASLNVYGFSVLRKSKLNAGSHMHEMIAVATTSAAQAQADIIAQLGSDLAHMEGPALIVANALYSGSAGKPVGPGVLP
jgi:hypothetical protein